MRLSLELAPATGLAELADAVATPGDPRFGRHLDRGALAGALAWPDAGAALQRWLADAGVHAITEGPGALTWRAEVERGRLIGLVGPVAAEALIARRRLVGADARALAPDVGAALRSIEVSAWRAPESRRTLVDPGGAAVAPTTGLAPAELLRAYRFPRALDGEGETIAVMALGGVPDPADIFGFARAFELPPPRIELVPRTPLGACASDPRFRFETTMGLQWLHAAAPGARIVVYLIDPAIVADPWAEFLQAVLSDMAMPTVAVTSWSAPARQYYPVHGGERVAGLLEQAAVLGISVVAASGDWGAYDGFPGGGPGRGVCERDGPGDTFPGCEARVLSVGGTHVVDAARRRETAWSAPISAALRAAVELPRLAGSGGVRSHVATPAYQRGWLPREFSRGPDAAPVPAHGRVQPDVALMAWGPDVAARPTAYACLLGGRFRDDAGGTSVAAPIWAGILARINQRRRLGGAPRLGQPHPLLYAACAREAGLLRDVSEGCTDIDLPVIVDGARVWRRLPGFAARRGFDPATGLGVPDVGRLVDVGAPPSTARGGP